jgi:hypothetical protein
MMSTLDQIIQAQAIKATHVASLLLKQNVVACGVGYKISGDQVTDTPSVVVSVARKLPVAQLASQDLVPGDLDGTPTDVVETGVIRAFDNTGPRDRWRPTVPPGVTMGHADITAGTFGCLVRRGEELFILSNNHVLANCNAGRAGDAILQPGRADGGTDADKVAELADYVAMNFDDGSAPAGCGASMMRLWRALSSRSGGGPAAFADSGLSNTNEVDVALARPLSAGLVSANILSIGVPRGTAQATLGTQVQKSGRTTGHTSGRIVQIDVTARVAYENQTASFVNQLMADGMSQPGDSGSAVLDMERNVVGLLFAGSNNTTLINPIQKVLAALGIQVVTA